MRSFFPRTALAAMVWFLAGCGGEGRQAYLDAGCDECHGRDLRGTPTAGPDLRHVDDHWTVESLLVYFRNPDSVAASDPRLSKLRARYGKGMPPLRLADPIARDALARYVLR